MAKNSVPLSAYLRYLRSLGLEGKGRKSGSHERWNFPDKNKQLLRSLTVDHNHEEVPLLHFKTNAMSYGKPWQEMWDDMIAKGFMKGGKRRKGKSK